MSDAQRPSRPRRLPPTDERLADPELEDLMAEDEGRNVPDDDRPVTEDANEYVPDDSEEPEA